MNKPDDIIKHPGTVIKIENGKIFVNIMAKSACASCEAKSICSVSEVEDKTIEVMHNPHREYQIGEQVQVIMQKTLAPKALFLGYVLPFIVVLISLILLIGFTGNEGLAAIVSLALLAPYYLILYKLRGRLGKIFMFYIE